MNKWDKRFYELALHISQWSKDRSTKVGAVIIDSNKRIISTGYNGMPMGCDDDLNYRHERPQKYGYFEHAERNAIYDAARRGVSTDGATIYLKWFPCQDCARAIIQSGIVRVVCEKVDLENNDKNNWGDKFKISKEMLEERGIEITYINPT